MTAVDALGRIAEIQSTLVQLRTPSTDRSAAGAQATSSTFATSLASALGATDAAPAGATGSDIVADAKKYLGVPYVFGGTDSSGMDCSGLVQRVFKDLGIDVPRLVSGQAKLGTEVPSLAEAQPGDLIVTGGGEHILIYAGDHKVIHAPREGKNVSLVEAYMDDSEIDTIRRVLPSAGTASPAALSGLGPLAGGASAASDSSALQSALFALLAGGRS
jgi:cell wall-associated NlpC family hydrolase